MAEKNITESDYKNLFDHHPMARFVLSVTENGECHIISSNASANKSFGISGDEAIGAPITQFFTRNTTDDLNDACARCITTKGMVTASVTPLFSNIIQRQTFILNPVLNDQGHVYMIDVIATVQDKKMNELKIERDTALQLVSEETNANRAKSAFLTNMSHELRTPLNAIIGFSEVIRDEVFGPIANDKYKEYLTDIHFSAQHLLEIINDVLDMSKIEAGKFVLVENDIDLNALFDAVKRIIAERATTKGIRFVTNIEDNLPHLYADKRVMRQILLNLISNAIKFSGNGDTITIKATLNNAGGLDIAVKDTGFGISQDNINKVLEPFNQAYDPLTNNGGHQGTGLGLSLTKAMAQLHDGSLSIESQLGKGTNVIIHMPETRVLSMGQEVKEIA